MVSRNTDKSHFIYAHRKGTAFPTPIVTKRTISNFVQISCPAFYLNPKLSVETTDRNLLKPLSKIKYGINCADFHET